MTTPNTTPTIFLPINRRRYPACWHTSPQDQRCNRPLGHTGRHLFYYRHLNGQVREVWA